MIRVAVFAACVSCICATVVVFTHVPKCGGTSISRELRAQAPDRLAYREAFPRTVTPAAEWVREGGHPGAEWVHVPYRDLPSLPLETVLITLVRDPVERVRSAYRFHRDNAHTEFTALLRRTPLDALVHQWQRYPQLAMQLWQPQLVLFFSDDALPQRAWLERNGCHRLDGCRVPDREHFVREWHSIRDCWEHRAHAEVVDDMTKEERAAIALVCAQQAAGLLDSMRGSTEREQLVQAVRYSLGRAARAAHTLRTRYTVLRLEALDLAQLDVAVPWFSHADANQVHTNSSPSSSADDSSTLSLGAYNMLRNEVLADDYAVLEAL